METAIPSMLYLGAKYLFHEYMAKEVVHVLERVVRITGMALLGALTTIGDVRCLCLPLILFYFWGRSSGKKEAGQRAFYFFLGATWILPESIITFYDVVPWRVPLGIMLWGVASFLLSLPFGALWNEHPWRRVFLAPLIVVLLTVPPFGVISVANPLLAAGVIFPGLKLFGILAVVLLSSLLSYGAKSIALLPPMVAAALFSSHLPLARKPHSTVSPISTTLSFETGVIRPTSDFDRAHSISTSKGEDSYRGKTVLLPEGVAGQMTEVSSGALWGMVRRNLGASALILGGEKSLPAGRENALYLIDGSTNKPTKLYTQRIPVPVSMWKPWKRGDSYSMHPFGEGTFLFRGATFGGLICYESLLVLPVIETLLKTPSEVLVVGNLWWARRTHLARIMEAYATSWERLFGIPFTVSLNR